MLKKCIILFFTFGIDLVLSKDNHFYRKDYTYIEEYDAYYKLHWDSSGWSWNSAFMACDSEGAKLFYPTGEEWTLVKNLTDSMVTPPNTTEIFVGLHNEFRLGEFITVDGKPTERPLNIDHIDDDLLSQDVNSCVVMDFTTGNFRVDECFINPDFITAFVCKKIETESCPTIDHGYKYVKAARQCLKVHNNGRTWLAAMQTCYKEGGTLAILENLSLLPELDLIQGQSYYLGFKKSFSTQTFYTVEGNKYEIADITKSYPDRDCGVLMNQAPYNGGQRISAESCDVVLSFICQMKANN